MHILQIEGHAANAQSAELVLRGEGFVVTTTDLGEDGVDLAKRYGYDLAIIGSHFSDMTGSHALHIIRAARVKTPIIGLSSDARIETRVAYLQAGADDYIAMPYHRDELLARIHAVIRRSCGHPSSVIDIGNIKVNLDRKQVTVDGVSVHFTATEYGILEYLALHKNTVVSKESLIDSLFDDAPSSNVMEVVTSRIRMKLQDANASRNIQTIRSYGRLLSDADVE